MHYRTSIVALFLALLVPLTSHADADRKEKGKISKAERTLKQAEDHFAYMRKMFGAASDYKEGIPAAVVARIDEKFPRLEELIGKCDEAIKAIDAATPDAAPLAERLQKLRDAGAQLQKEVKGTGEKLAAEDSDLAAGLETDKPRCEAVTAQLEDVIGGLRSETREPGWLDNWAQVQKDAAALVGKYDGKKASSTAARWMVSAVGELKSKLAKAIEGRNSALTDIPARVDQQIASAKKYANEAVATGQFGQFTERVQPILWHLENQAYIIRTIAKDVPNADTSVLTRIADATKELNDQQAKHEAKIIATNVVPADAYQGGDRASLQAIATKAYSTDNPNGKALLVRFTTSEWSRSSSFEWDANRSAWVKRDFSTLGGVVFGPSEDGKQAWAYPVQWMKNHMAGDKVGLNYLTIRGKPLSPFRIFPIAKVK